MLKQKLQLKLSQKLSPQQIQLMKLIQLSTLDLEQQIQTEIGENPALESGIDDYNFENQEANYKESDKSDSKEVEIDEYINYDDIPFYSSTRVDPDAPEPTGQFELRDSYDFRPTAEDITGASARECYTTQMFTLVQFLGCAQLL